MIHQVDAVTRGMKARRFKEAAAMLICGLSAAGGWYGLHRGAEYGTLAGAICAIWTLTYCWLSGRLLPFKVARGATIFEIYRTARSSPRPRRPDTPLERVIAWGSTVFFLMLAYWIFSGAWLNRAPG